MGMLDRVPIKQTYMVRPSAALLRQEMRPPRVLQLLQEQTMKER
jgi:hypothetical protein